MTSEDGTLGDSAQDDTVRRSLGLPPVPSSSNRPGYQWWTQYHQAERAVLRYLRAVDTLPAEAAERDRLTELRGFALDQLRQVGELCVRGAAPKASVGRRTKRERQRLARARARQRSARLAEVVRALERFADSAAATAFAYALADAEGAVVPPDPRDLEDALEAVVAALDELNTVSREFLDP